jgi:hypothetical protein
MQSMLGGWAVTSLPVCWDTLRAGTNEGYFEFNQTTILAHIAISY